MLRYSGPRREVHRPVLRARSSGIAGFLGQPAVLQAADARVTDERIEAAYATLFAFAIIVKILLLPVITSFL